jgi:chorismate synthase
MRVMMERRQKLQDEQAKNELKRRKHVQEEKKRKAIMKDKFEKMEGVLHETR